MNFYEFKTQFFSPCLSIHNIQSFQPEFNPNNLTRWVKKGYLIRLRKGYYSFPEYRETAGIGFYIANQIYRPTYISLQSALAYHGLIPEAIANLTSVSPMKTKEFSNLFGKFQYRTLKSSLMFGYSALPVDDKRIFLLAEPEKALLDLLYIYPFYNNEQEINELRLDPDIIMNVINRNILQDYTLKFKNKALEQRVNIFKKWAGI
ncbi:hypothetical protein KAJ27_00630 [bacterium]|nr:hypothetical protein [bacterium]